MPKTRFRSDAFEAVHSATSDLHDLKVISKQTMRKFDETCIEAAPAFDAKDIARLRNELKVSQSVFAFYLNTSTSTVAQWERGDKRPSGIAARLLQIVQKHGLAVIA